MSRAAPAAPAEAPSSLARDANEPGKVERSLVDWAARNRVGLSLTVAILPSGRTVLAHEGSTARNPASVSKLVTALVALRSLGPSYRFRTRLHGRLVDGTAERLVVRGEGDPTLSSDHVQGMAARVVAMGLTKVDGPIVVDQSYFDERFVPPAFDQQPNEWAAFRAPVCATAVDGNRLVLHVVPAAAGASARVYVEPLGAAEISGSITTAEQTPAGGQRIRFSIGTSNARPLVRVGGEIGAHETSVTLQKRVEDPRLMVGYVLREALSARGVKLNGGVALGEVDGLPALLSHSSEALSALLYRLGKDSDNFAAEMLLKAIGARATGEGATAAGVNVVLQTLAALSEKGGSVRWTNGSGLFDANRISTDVLVEVLAGAYRDRQLAPEYLSQLALGGADGTLASRLRNLKPGCFVRAKTGTLRATISLAGYVERSDGQNLAFAMIVEDVKSQANTRAELDRFVASLCEARLESSRSPVDLGAVHAR